MVYVLGLIFADGAVEDVRKSSRTCYIQVASKDKPLLEQVRKALSSDHTINTRKAKVNDFFGKKYLCSEIFNLRIGNKLMYQDLIDKGLIPRKSLIMKLPYVPREYFDYFLRGYFDGDGCISIYRKPGGKAKIVQVVFVSGSYDFLDKLSKKIQNELGISRRKIYNNTRSFKISYKKHDSLRILHYMYKNLSSAPYLERKYKKFKSIYDS